MNNLRTLCVKFPFKYWFFNVSFALLFLMIIASGISYSYSKNNTSNHNYKIIKIKKGDTLYRICKAHYGKYSQKIVNHILTANPSIKNKNLIIAGSRMRLPDVKEDKKEDKIDKNKPPEKKNRPVFKDSHEHINFFATSDVVYEEYPPPAPGSITVLRWLDDNRAMVKGNINIQDRKVFSGHFFVFVPGDIEYKQSEINVLSDEFCTEVTIGRKGRDYNKPFMLKLALINKFGDRIGEIRQTIVKKRHQVNQEIKFKNSSQSAYSANVTGWRGIVRWLDLQKISALEIHNSPFQVPNGIVTPNYRYLSYNPDEKYLSWYERITLYGSSCAAKALLLNNEIETAESILRVWAAQIDHKGRIPRSANVIGDNYISPDARSGEIAHFLGAIAMARAFSGNHEWGSHVKNIVNNYFSPLISQKTGLVQGGYNGNPRSGYKNPFEYKTIQWCSAEHNFDLYQALIFISKVSDFNLNFRNRCTKMANRIAAGIDKYLWNEKEGTFNRGWRPSTGNDEAKALDCASWGALYLLKRLRLAQEHNNEDLITQCAERAAICLQYAETHFKTRWYYKTQDGVKGSIKGYRPYDGVIDDIVWQNGEKKGNPINWDMLNDMVWSEGSLGIAKAWECYARLLNDKNAKKRSREIYNEMIEMQSLSDQGGLLYSSAQIKGHFTMGEELASLGWLGYLTLTYEEKALSRLGPLINWIPW